MARLPEVAAYVARAGDGVWDLLLACPFCGDLHLHGGGSDDEPTFGQRLSHCVHDDRRGDYGLVPGPDGMPKPWWGERRRSQGRGGYSFSYLDQDEDEFDLGPAGWRARHDRP